MNFRTTSIVGNVSATVSRLLSLTYTCESF